MGWVEPLLAWVGAHPWLALAIIFGTALGDSLFLIGFIFPSALILFGVGALVALDVLPLWPVIAAATLGAIAGDLLNFWIGLRWGERALASPVAQRYRDTIALSRRFFVRHGGKGLILGRLIGLIRPCVPMIAGAYGMRVLPCVLWVCVSGFVWAWVYILPGIAVGASLGLAAEVATRLAILLIAALLLVWLLTAGTARVARYAQARGERWIVLLLRWSRRHRRLGRLGSWLADPDKPETPALLIFAVLLTVAGWIWLALWWGVARHHPLPMDAWVYQTMQDLHTPWGLAVAGWLAHLGDAPVMLAVGAATVLALLWLRQARAAAHAIAAIVFSVLISLGLSVGVQVPDPVHYFAGDTRSRFTGGDLVITTVVLALLPVLLTTGRPAHTRTRHYSAVAAALGLIAGSQLYLGVQWFSVAAFALIIGSLWIIVLGVGYRRHNATKVPSRGFVTPVLVTFVAAATFLPATRSQLPQAAPPTPVPVSTQQWWESEYARLPAYRGDSAGRMRQPLNVQWLGNLEDIESALRQAGWRRPVPLTGSTALRFLSPSAPIAELPLMPQVHFGRHQRLVLTRSGGDDHEYVIRFWSTAWIVDGQPLWLGSLTRQRTRSVIGLAQRPATEPDFNQPMALLWAPPPGFAARQVRHPGHEGQRAQWSGGIWLMYPAASNKDTHD